MGISTGVGPLSLYQSLGSKRRRASKSKGSHSRQASAGKVASAAARHRELADARRRQEAQAIIDAFASIMNLHHFEPVPVEPPAAQPPEPVDERGIRERYERQALAKISIFKRELRREAKAEAARAAAQEIEDLGRQRLCDYYERQARLDGQWVSLCANDAETVMRTLLEAFEDNEAPAAVVGVEGSEAAIVVAVPSLDVIPDRLPQPTKTGRLSMPKLAQGKRASFYLLMVCGHLLLSVREAFAVAPGLQSVQTAVVSLSDIDAYGRHVPQCLMAGRFARKSLEGVRWMESDATRIVHDTATELLVRTVGQSAALRPLDLTQHPELAELIARIDVEGMLSESA